MFWTALAAVLLAFACTQHAHGLDSKFLFKTGESLQFVGESTSFRYHPSESGSNCTNCFLFIKLGALSELDAYGQPVKAHLLPDLSKLNLEATAGRSVAGNAEYNYVTMSFSSQSLLDTLTEQACPTLESILRQASALGVSAQGDAQGGSLPAQDASIMGYHDDPAARALANPTSAAALATVMSQSSFGVADATKELPETSSGRRLSSTSAAVRRTAVQPVTVISTPAAGAAVQPYSAARQATIPMAVATAAPFTAPKPTAGGRFVDGRNMPHLKVTFMFGFSNNRTFPYGRGNVLSTPAGSVRWTFEAQNWPFCSPYNTLKLELVAVSSMRDNQAQFVLNSPEVERSEPLVTDMMSEAMRMIPSVRKLQASHQYADNYGASFFETETLDPAGRQAAGLPLRPLAGHTLAPNMDPTMALQLLQDVPPAIRMNTAKLLVGPALAATFKLPTFAFAGSEFTGLSNVSVALTNNATDGTARFSMTFGYFTSGLYYDSVIHFSDILDMNVAEAGSLPPASMRAGATCLPGDEACVNSRQSSRRGMSNAAVGLSDGKQVHMHIWALLLAVLASWL